MCFPVKKNISTLTLSLGEALTSNQRYILYLARYRSLLPHTVTVLYVAAVLPR